MLKSNQNSIYQFMAGVYFTAGLAICGMMVNRSIASELLLVKQNFPAIHTGNSFDKDTAIYNHFIQ
jgi:hypothetical protein